MLSAWPLSLLLLCSGLLLLLWLPFVDGVKCGNSAHCYCTLARWLACSAQTRSWRGNCLTLSLCCLLHTACSVSEVRQQRCALSVCVCL